MSNKKPKTLVIGAGLIGTSIAMGLVKAGYEVFIDDSDVSATDLATTRSQAKKFAGQLVDLVVVATPPSTVAQVIREVFNTQPTAVVTDVASVKGSILTSLKDLDQQQLSRIVGGHPMAGREVSGAAGAQNNLFVDRSWVVTKLAQTSPSAVDLVQQMISDLGAVPVDRDVDAHDQTVALISHTPQIIASVLAGELVDAKDHEVELAGQGLRDTIRIASSDAKLWSDILSGNAKHVASRISSIAAQLTNVAKALESGDQKTISEMLKRGSAGRDRLPGKHGTAAKLDSQIVVRLEDKPGELARLFAAAATANVNLEDVRIDHSLGRMTGLVELTVAQDKREVLISALNSADFIVVN
jgi:prephenate dehydrogenase